jgi:hypothetical protein
MGPAIGDVLPLAVGIAISPVPIIVAILILLSPKAKGAGLGYLLGWVLGIVVAVTAFTLVSSGLPAETGGSKPVAGVIKLLLGAGLLFLAMRQWKAGHGTAGPPKLPKWMSAVDTLTPVKSLVIGFLLVAVNPKNLLLGVSAGVSIGSAQLEVGSIVVVIAVFTVVAAVTVAGPIVAYLVASDRMHAPLESLRVWLVANNSTVMSVLLLVMGVVMIGKGVSSF